jgi:hypothetical protein
MSDARIISLGDLPTGNPAAVTDTIAVCQNPEGCGGNDTLIQMSLGKVADFVLEQIPPPQYISEIVLSASRMSLTNNTVVTVATLMVPPGEWLISGEVWFDLISGNAANVNRLAAAVAPDVTSPIDPADDTSVNVTANIGVGVVLPLGNVYVNNTGTLSVPYYLTANAVWTGSVSLAAYGKIAGSTVQ